MATRVAIGPAWYAAVTEKVDTESFSHLPKLKALRLEHRDLDEVIHKLSLDSDVDQIMLKRLKKRKLQLKDAITRLESELIPDLNA